MNKYQKNILTPPLAQPEEPPAEIDITDDIPKKNSEWLQAIHDEKMRRWELRKKLFSRATIDFGTLSIQYFFVISIGIILFFVFRETTGKKINQNHKPKEAGMKYFLSFLLIFSLFVPGLVLAGDSDYRKPIGGEDDSSSSQEYGGSPAARHQNETTIIINGESDERRQFEDQWGYHHKEDHKFQGFGEKKQKRSQPPSPPQGAITTQPRGAINERTGEYYPPAAGGVTDPKDGTFYQETPGGYINTRTGEFYPKQ